MTSKLRIRLPASLKSKKYPDFIRNYPAIKSSPEVKKNFKSFGITNFSEKYTHTAMVSLEEYVSLLKSALEACYQDASHRVNATTQNYLGFLNKHITVSSVVKNKRLVLPCPISVFDNYREQMVRYGKGSSLLSVIATLLSSLYETNYFSMIETFESIISHGIDLELSWQKSLRLVFSSHPWDIATMSMRGISSCQAWGKKQSTSLIGSILDPNVGVMYLTGGKAVKALGNNMIARSVIRLAFPYAYSNTGNQASEKEKKTRAVVIEAPYLYYSRGFNSAESKMTDIFKKALSNNSKKKIRFYDPRASFQFGETSDQYWYALPLTSEIINLPASHLSYRDSEMDYALGYK